MIRSILASCVRWTFAGVLWSHLALADAQPGPPSADRTSDNPEVLAASSPPVAVHLGTRRLFDVTNALDSLSAAQRAQAIERRLSSLANGPSTTLASLRVVDQEHLCELFAGDVLIRTITEQDAVAGGSSRQLLAAQQLAVIRSALEEEFRDRDSTHIWHSLIEAAVATVVLGALMVSLRWSYRLLQARLNRTAEGWKWRSPLDKLKVFDSQTVTRAGRTVAKVLAWLVGILIIYVYLEYVLSLFPWTRGFADQMSDAAKAAILRVVSGLFDYVPSFINIVVIIAVARFMLVLLKRVFEQVATERFRFEKFHPEWAMPTYSLVRFFVIAIAAVMVFPYLPGSGSEGFRGVSAFVGLMVSFGAAPAIANLIAGTIITYMRPFKIGDRVKIADATGDILGKDLLVVRMRTIKNVDITIPNALVLANHIVNFSSSAKSHGLILNVTITIGYDAPWKIVHGLLIAAAKRVDGVRDEPAPFVLQTALDDSYVAYEINAYTNRPNEMATLYSRLNEAIQDTFNEAGVEILSPQYAAVRDGNHKAVPESYLPKDYEAPGFGLLSRVLRTDPRR